MRKLLIALAVGLLVAVAFAPTVAQNRGDPYGAAALQRLEQAFKTTGVISFPNYAAAHVTCNAANVGVHYYDTADTIAYICAGAGPAWADITTSLTVGTAFTIPRWNAGATDLEDSNLLNNAVPAAGASGNVLVFDATFNAMDAAGGDVVYAVHLDTTNYDAANHTGGTFAMFNIEGITEDAQADETAINIGVGWDYAIAMPDIVQMAFGNSQDIKVNFNTANYVVDMNDVATTYGARFELGNNAASTFVVQNAAAGNSFDLRPIGTAGASWNFLELDATVVGAMTDGDVTNLLFIDMDDGEYASGTVSTLNGINIDGISSDVDSTDTAVLIGDGWDYAITIPDGGAADNAISLGDVPGTDPQIYWDGTALTFDVDGTSGDDVLFSMQGTGDANFTVGWATGSEFIFIPANGGDTGFNIFEIQVVAVNPTNGSDTISMLELDWNETDWATVTETLNGLNIDAITQDTQGTYYAVVAGAGWDVSFRAANRRVDDAEAIECTDEATGANQAITLTPTGSYVEITQSDAHGCDVTMGEAAGTVYEGQLVDIAIVAVTAGAVNFADTGGLSELAGAFAADINDTLRLRYTGTTWVEVTRSAN